MLPVIFTAWLLPLECRGEMGFHGFGIESSQVDSLPVHHRETLPRYSINLLCLFFDDFIDWWLFPFEQYIDICIKVKF